MVVMDNCMMLLFRMELFWKLLISLLIVEISGQIQTQKAQLYITYPISGKVKLYIDATERAILAGVLKAQELLPTVVIRNDYFASVNDKCDQTTAFQLLISDFLGYTTNVNDNVGPGYLDVIIGISCNQAGHIYIIYIYLYNFQDIISFI